jgi:hypothetical protein
MAKRVYDILYRAQYFDTVGSDNKTAYGWETLGSGGLPVRRNSVSLFQRTLPAPQKAMR